MSLHKKHRRSVALAITFTCFFTQATFGQEKTEADPWFTEEREAPEAVEEKDKDEDKETVVLRETKPTTIVKKLKKDLNSIPQNNLNQRISLLEEIVSTAKPLEKDQQLLIELKAIRTGALEAISQASQETMPLEVGIERLSPYSKYYRGDSTLIIKLLDSDFTNRLKDRVASLGRLNMVAELSLIETKIDDAGLASVYGTQVQQSVSGATATMIARKWEELTQGQTKLPAESYLIGQLLKQEDQKLLLAIDLPQNADPNLSLNVSRSIERRWGDNFQLTSTDQRTRNPEFILKIDLGRIRSTHTTKENSSQSIIPGEIIEEPNPDFLETVKKYEKAAKAYEVEVDSYEARYQYYIDALDDTEYRQAQDELERADELLSNTPPPTGPEASPQYDAALAYQQTAQATANSISMPTAIEPQKPIPFHLDILEDLYLIPSTIIISEEKTPYEYTEQELAYLFETDAPISLKAPLAGELEVKSTISLNQKRKWTKNIGVDPRDPTVDDGTYSENEYFSALDIFGLEFAAHCNQELSNLLEKATTQLSTTTSAEELDQILLLLALKSVTSDAAQPELNDEELSSLAELAMDKDVTPARFRASCLAKVLSKSEFSHLANEDEIAQAL